MNKYILLILSIFSLSISQAQIQMDATGHVGLGSAPSSSYPLNVEKTQFNDGARILNSDYLFFGADEVYGSNYGMKLAQGGSSSVLDFSTIFLVRAKSYNHAVRMSINASNGYVGIGRNPASYKLDVNGTIRVESTVYTSDIRLKTDIKPMDSCLLRIKSLKPISYFMSEGSEQSSNGYIAPTGTSSAQKANDLKPSDADSVSSFDPEVYAEKCKS